VVKSIIADAYNYVNDHTGPKFDIVFMDINYSEDNLELSPPKKFLETAFLQKLVVRSAMLMLLGHDYSRWLRDFQFALLRLRNQE